MARLYQIFLVCLLIGFSSVSFGQVQNPADSVREFEVLRAASIRYFKIDSVTTLQTLAGNVIIKQGTTRINCDSAVVNNHTHIVESFGNIHINQADSLHTYGQYLKYVGAEKMAYLKRNVRLTDGKGTLLTQSLDYNLETGIGNFYEGGKVTENKTVITSTEGTYYSDTKDVYFKKNVKLDNEKDHVRADSLLYNMSTKISSFISKTNIKNKEVEINTNQGTYDLNTGNAFFTSRTNVVDSSGRVYTADNMALEHKSGNAQLEGNAVIIDTAGNFIVMSNQIFLNQQNKSFLATRKPVAIIIKDSDSTYIAADTLFSGISTRVEMEKMKLRSDSIMHVNIEENKKVLQVIQTDTSYVPLPADSSKILPPPMHGKDSINQVEIVTASLSKDSLYERSAIVNTESKDSLSAASSIKDNASLQKENKLIDSSMIKKSANKDTLTNSKVSEDSTIRYFLAFNNVRIYNDSLQSVSDSMFYSTADSTFRLYYDPVVWSGATQLTGDTIFLYTENNKPKRLYAFEKTLSVNRTREGFFNQMSGKTMNGYFVDGNIDFVRVKGSQAESVYYMQDADSAYIGMNRASGDAIDLYFKKDELLKVVFMNQVDGAMYPMQSIPTDQKELRNFQWLDTRRPKNKLELFQ